MWNENIPRSQTVQTNHIINSQILALMLLATDLFLSLKIGTFPIFYHYFLLISGGTLSSFAQLLIIKLLDQGM